MRSSRLSRSVGLVSIAGMAAAFSLSTQALAQTLTWNNAAGGSAGTAANWNPAQVPTAANILNFNLAGNYAISFPATVPTSAQQNFNIGTISLSTLVPHTATQQFVVGLNAGSTPAVTLTAGSISSGVISVGGNPTSTASLTITGVTADMFSTGAAGTRLGNTGNGTVTISNGGSLTSTNLINIGSAAGSQGTVTVTGMNGGVRSELVTLNATTGALNVGVLGTGTLNVASAARVDVASSAFIAPNAGVTGTVSVGNACLFNVAGDLHVGSNTTAAAAGTGSLTLSSSMTSILGRTFVGDSAGGSGTLTVNSGSHFTTGSLTIHPSNGSMVHNGGNVTIDGGTLSVPNNQMVVNGSNGTILALESATCTLSAPLATRALTIGSTQNAVFDVRNNALLSIASGDVSIGDSIGSVGQLQCQLAGSVTHESSGVLYVGNNGTGTVFVGAGGTLSCGTVQSGIGSTGSGIFSVSGNSALNITGTLALGGTLSTTSGGSADMTIGGGVANPGAVTVTSGHVVGGINTRVHFGSSLTINAGGTLVSDAVVRSTGVLTLAGGTIDAPNVVPSGPGPYNFTGTIVGLFQPQSTLINLTGPLTVGTLISTANINVGDHTFSVIDSSHNEWVLGDCTVGSTGRVVAPDGLRLQAGRVLSSAGSIDADLTNEGTITATGSGCTLNGNVTGIGQGIGGTSIVFGPSGGYFGQGTFSGTTSISGQTGSVIHATGALQLGNSASSSGFDTTGTIEVEGLSIVTLRDSAVANVRNIAFLNGNPADATAPAVTCSPGMRVLNGSVTGTGRFGAGSSSSLLITNSTLSPGLASIRGTLFPDCDTTLDAASDVEIEIFDSISHDQIRTLSHTQLNPNPSFTPSDIFLNGTLTLRVAPGHTPTSGESHLIIATSRGILGPDGQVNGTFHTFNLPRHWHINVVPFELSGVENGVYAVYCNADFNEDGELDFFDYLDFVDAFSTGDSIADFNSDSIIDFFDYLDFVDAFSAGC